MTESAAAPPHNHDACAACMVEKHAGHAFTYRQDSGRLIEARCEDCEVRYVSR